MVSLAAKLSITLSILSSCHCILESQSTPNKIEKYLTQILCGVLYIHINIMILGQLILMVSKRHEGDLAASFAGEVAPRSGQW